MRDTASGKIASLKKSWQESTLSPLVKRFGERKIAFVTSDERMVVDTVYTPDEDAGAYMAKLGLPGEYPFTRGVQPNMYRGRLWTMRQYAGFGNARESNARYKFLIAQGQTGLSVAFDLPTQIGYDADHEFAEGEVGKVGVSISSLRDMETLLDGIPLDKVSISMTINAPAAVLLAMVVAVGKQQGVSSQQLRGTVQNDILKEYIARGTYIFPPAPSMRLITDIFRFCATDVPKWNTISISGYHIREAGSTAVQEVAFTLANGMEYVKQAIAAGLDLDHFAPQLSFFFNAHNNILEEVAKFRAARRLWARILRERFGATNPDSWKLRFHTQTGGSTLTAQQPDNNIVRVTLQALAAVLGGTQSLHTNSKDEELALPTQKSVEIALRTQQIIAYETNVAHVADPLGGSWYVEALTDEMEKRAEEIFALLDEMGEGSILEGVIRGIEENWFQKRIADSAYELEKKMGSKRRTMVGVNRFTEGNEEDELEILEITSADEERQLKRLDLIRAQRDEKKVAAVLAKLAEQAADESVNLMPTLIEAAREYATLGEIMSSMLGVFGRHVEVPSI